MGPIDLKHVILQITQHTTTTHLNINKIREHHYNNKITEQPDTSTATQQNVALGTVEVKTIN